MTEPSAASPSHITKAWRRFRTLLWWSGLAGLAAAGAAVWWVSRTGTTLSLHLILAMGGGIFLSVLLGAALMGLVFLSNRTGHDDEAATGFDADDRP